MQRKLSFAFCVAVASAGVIWAAGSLNGSKAGAKEVKRPQPLRIAVVDMGKIFKGSRKFNAMRAKLKKQVGRSKKKLDRMANELKQLQKELKGFKPGSDEFEAAQKSIIERSAKLQAARKSIQRELRRKEADIFLEVYNEIRREIAQYAKEKGVQLVIRHHQNDIDPSTPEKVAKGMGRQVVFQDGLDITEDILTRLNKQSVAGITVD